MPDEVTDRESGQATEAAEQALLLWPSRVRILFNPIVWTSVVLGFGIASCFVGILFAILARSFWGLLMGAGGFVVFMVIFIGIGIVVDLFGGFRVTFALTSTGVRSVAGKGTAAASSAAVWGGILAANPAAMGAGLLARSEKNVFIPYEEVTKIKVSEGRLYILVKGGFGQKPIGLYCKPENFQQALGILKERCPSARFLGARLPV